MDQSLLQDLHEAVATAIKTVLLQSQFAEIIDRCQIDVSPEPSRSGGYSLTLKIPDSQRSLDLIPSLSSSILKIEECVLGYSIRRILIQPHEHQCRTLSWTVGNRQRFAKILNQQQSLVKALPIMEGLEGIVKYLHAETPESGFKILGLATDWVERLFDKPENIKDRPVDFLPGELGEKRKHYLERAVRSGSHQHYTYSHRWGDVGEAPRDWLFEADIIYLPGMGAAINCTRDANPKRYPNFAGQAEYWSAKRQQ